MRTQKFRLVLTLKKNDGQSVVSEIEVTGDHRTIKERLRRSLGEFKAKAAVGTFVIEVSEAGQEIRVEDIEVGQAIVDQFASLARGGYDDMVRYGQLVERFMVSEGIPEARRVASEIMVRPELFEGIDAVEVQLMERCRGCGGFHDKDKDGFGVISMLTELFSGRGSSFFARFGKAKKEMPALVFHIDSNSELARHPLFNKADFQAKLVAETKEWLVEAVEAKDVDLAMAKVRDEEGIAHNNATLEALRLRVEQANASHTQHLAAVALEADGLRSFTGTLRASGIEVFTPACDEAFPVASESTTATDNGADGKDTAVLVATPADDSAGRVSSPAAFQAAPAASGATDGSDDDTGSKGSDDASGDGIGDNANTGDTNVVTA